MKSGFSDGLEGGADFWLNFTDWNLFSQEEKLNAENTVLAVGLLYEMCKVKLVLASKSETEKNEINYPAINDALDKSTAFLGTA